MELRKAAEMRKDQMSGDHQRLALLKQISGKFHSLLINLMARKFTKIGQKWLMRFSTLDLDSSDLDGSSAWCIHPYSLKYSSLTKCILNLSKTEIFMCISPGTIVVAMFNNCGATRDLSDEYKLSTL